MTAMITDNHEVTKHLALALDVDDLVVATRVARDMAPFFGIVKIGLELYTAAGPEAIGAMRDLGYEIFVDLKLHDIPTTVSKAARVLGVLGANYVTMHAHGGLSMLRAGVEGLQEGALASGAAPGMAIAVTVLTTDADAPPHIVPRRAATAIEAGCGGIVCAAGDLREVREIGPRLSRVVPGIRPACSERHDQVRSVTPAEAVKEGATILVIGRAVTEAPDPRAAAASIVREIAGVEPAHW